MLFRWSCVSPSIYHIMNMFLPFQPFYMEWLQLFPYISFGSYVFCFCFFFSRGFSWFHLCLPTFFHVHWALAVHRFLRVCMPMRVCLQNRLAHTHKCTYETMHARARECVGRCTLTQILLDFLRFDFQFSNRLVLPTFFTSFFLFCSVFILSFSSVSFRRLQIPSSASAI